MMFAYAVMVFILLACFLFLYWAVTQSLLSTSDSSSQATSFQQIRYPEIAEEFAFGRITEDEREQLLFDLETEGINQLLPKSYARKSNLLESWLFLVVVVFVVLGSVILYDRLGYSKEVVFTQAVASQNVSAQQVSDFLAYRVNRYDRPEDWFYQASNFMQNNDVQKAVESFEKALSKMPEGAEGRIAVQVEYVQALFYANGSRSSDKIHKEVDSILKVEPTQAAVLGLKGVAQYSEKNYLGAILAWQEAIRYNPKSGERIALLGAIAKARDAGAISFQQVPPVITHQIAVRVIMNSPGQQWQANDVVLVYAKVEGQPMPVSIQRVFPESLNQPILLTNLDALMPTVTLAETQKVDLIVKLSDIRDNDLTKGRIIGIKEDVLTNHKGIIEIKVSL